jgi:hypothetical protein
MVTNYGAWGSYGADYTYYFPHRIVMRAAGVEPTVPSTAYGPQATAMPPQTYGPPGFPSGQGWSPFPAPTPGNVPIPPGFDPSGQGAYYPLATVPGAPTANGNGKAPPWVAPVGIGTGILLLGLIILGLTAGRRRRRVY